MKKKIFMPAIVLCSICIVVALLLSFVNMVTSPIIKERQNAAVNEALLEVLPNGKNFEKIEITSEYPEAVTEGYRADGGFVFKVTVTGKSTGLVIMCGIDSNGNVVGTKVIANNETPDYAEKVFPAVEGLDGKYKGMTLDGFDPYLVSGATLTSKAYADAIKAALQAAAIAGGDSVDVRTPEQILQDNCNAALGTSSLKFTKWFALEHLEGIDAVYVTDDNTQRVYVIGESFIGVKSGAIVTAEVSDENKALALSADAIIVALTLEDVAIPDGAAKTIKSIKKVSNGAYVFELSANGYQSNFEYGNRTPISIKLAISADGKILNVLTVEHNETDGLGSYCATEEYYEQYLGKGDEDVKISSKYPIYHHDDLIPDNSTDVGVISGATYTTVGYQTAIKDAFKAFEFITAGGNK